VCYKQKCKVVSLNLAHPVVYLVEVVFHDIPGPFHVHFYGPFMSIFHVFPVPFTGMDWISNKSDLSYTDEYLTPSSKLH